MADETPYHDLFDPSKAAYTPSETSAYGLKAIEEIRDKKDKAINLGLEFMEEYFAPVRPGQVAGVVGQTSYYKSGLLHLIEHKAASQIRAQGREGEAVIHVSVEEGIEEQAFLEFARNSGEDAGKLANGEVRDWEELVKVSYKVADVPIFRIGDSLERSKHMQPLHMSNIFLAIAYVIEAFKVRPALISIDYLQALPKDVDIVKTADDSQRRLQVRRDAYRCRQMSTYFSAPVWVACQAKQQLANVVSDKGNPLLIPGMYDINESADVSQRFDRLIATWLPARTYPIGTKLRVGQEDIIVTDNLLFIKVNKQRGGLPAGRIFICEIDFKTNNIFPRTVETFPEE